MSRRLPFWKTKTLEEMSPAEWESLCDGCGRCCLHKLRDDDTGALSFTNVACRLLNTTTCRCADYARRQRWVPDCVRLTPAEVRAIDWLPPSCAYRRVAEGKGLAWWHPLVSGDPDTVHAAGISVRGRVVSEQEAGPLEHHIVEWPGRNPRASRVTDPHAARVTDPHAARVTDPHAARVTDPGQPRPSATRAPRAADPSAPRASDPRAPRASKETKE